MNYSRRRLVTEIVFLAAIGVVLTAASIYALKDGTDWIRHGSSLTEGAMLLRLSRLAVMMEIVWVGMLFTFLICFILGIPIGYSAPSTEDSEMT